MSQNPRLQLDYLHKGKDQEFKMPQSQVKLASRASYGHPILRIPSTHKLPHRTPSKDWRGLTTNVAFGRGTTPFASRLKPVNMATVRQLLLQDGDRHGKNRKHSVNYIQASSPILRRGSPIKGKKYHRLYGKDTSEFSVGVSIHAWKSLW